MNKKGNNKEIIFSCFIMLLLILYQLFNYKTIYLDKSHYLEVSISNIIYPFTFLFTILIYNILGFKDTHKTIIKVILSYILFIIIATIINNINTLNTTYDVLFRELFSNNSISIKNITLYYPNLLNLVMFSLIFYFSHTIIILLYDALKPYINKTIAFLFSMFIPYTIDAFCSVIIVDIVNKVDFNTAITHLTSNFVIVIVSTIILTTFYSSKKQI